MQQDENVENMLKLEIRSLKIEDFTLNLEIQVLNVGDKDLTLRLVDNTLTTLKVMNFHGEHVFEYSIKVNSSEICVKAGKSYVSNCKVKFPPLGSGVYYVYLASTFLLDFFPKFVYIESTLKKVIL